MAADRPKQYLLLGDRMVIEVTLGRLAEVEDLAGVVVGVATNDSWWPEVRIPESLSLTVCPGGRRRAQTVLNGLRCLETEMGAHGSDAVLVHDAVRPLVDVGDIRRLVDECAGDPDGGLLGCPVSDTLKYVGSEGRVGSTRDREGLWRAMTPQLFPLQTLKRALESADTAAVVVTDESEAIERLGMSPRMIDSDPMNLKITRPADLKLVQQLLEEAGHQAQPEAANDPGKEEKES